MRKKRGPGHGGYVEITYFKDRKKRKAVDVLISICIV